MCHCERGKRASARGRERGRGEAGRGVSDVLEEEQAQRGALERGQDWTHLEERLKLVDDVRRRALLLEFAQARVGADDLGELVREVVLAAHGAAVDRDRGPHGHGRHGEHGEDHPGRVRLGRREAHRDEVIVRDLAEERVGVRRRVRLAVGLLHVAVLREGRRRRERGGRRARSGVSKSCRARAAEARRLELTSSLPRPYTRKSLSPSRRSCGCSCPQPPWPGGTSSPAAILACVSSSMTVISHVFLTLTRAWTMARRFFGSRT